MSETSTSVSVRHASGKTEAQKWGETAVAFIASATTTGVFGLLSYILWSVNQWLAHVSLGLAGLAFVMLAINSIAIVKWWIIIAKRSS